MLESADPRNGRPEMGGGRQARDDGQAAADGNGRPEMGADDRLLAEEGFAQSGMVAPNRGRMVRRNDRAHVVRGASTLNPEAERS